MFAKLVTPPVLEPVSLTEAKLHLRLAVDDSDAANCDVEDSKISVMITAAREFVENHTRLALITQTRDVAFDYFPSGIFIPLPFAPLQSVTSISYTGTDGSSLTFTDFEVDLFVNAAKLKYGFSWPETQYRSRVIIRIVSGYGTTAASVPASIKQAMLLLIGHYYANSEAVIVDNRVAVDILPMGVESLLAGFRRYEF